MNVSLGTWVRLMGFEPGEEEVFSIVPADQANALENRIPSDSPLARAIEGAQAGDTVSFQSPSGKIELKILEVGQL